MMAESICGSGGADVGARAMEAGELGEASRVLRRRIKGWCEHTDLMLKVFFKLPVYKAAQF